MPFPLTEAYTTASISGKPERYNTLYLICHFLSRKHTLQPASAVNLKIYHFIIHLQFPLTEAYTTASISGKPEKYITLLYICSFLSRKHTLQQASAVNLKIYHFIIHMQFPLTEAYTTASISGKPENISLYYTSAVSSHGSIHYSQHQR